MVEIIDDTWGVYNTSSQIKFKTTMLKSRLCDCSDVYILVERTVTVTSTGTVAALNKKKARE